MNQSSTSIPAVGVDAAHAPGRFSPVAGAPELSTLLERAREISGGFLKPHAQLTEESRRVSQEATALFRDAGFFRLMQPAQFGGYEYGFSAFADIISELGRGCPSSAWGCSLGAVHQWLIGTFPAQAQEDVWGKTSDAIVCGSYAPTIKAEAVAGGYVVSGRWHWASNIDNSQWAMIGVQFAPDDETPVPHAGFLLVPREEWSVHDDWFTSGQAGTGSKAVDIQTPTFVPGYRKLTFAQASSNVPPGAALNTNPIYRIPFLSALPVCLVSPILGAAQGALDEFLAVAGTRVTRGAVAGGGSRLAEFFPVQSRVAEAAAMVDAARLLINRDLAEVESRAAAGQEIDVDTRIRNRLDHAFAARLARDAINAIFDNTGGNGLALSQPIQRLWRDGNAIAKHISLNWDAVSSMAGQHLLGLEPKGQY
ncbi:flavin-dependent monooxygenase oxygenase subunit (plasmid) [Cupriavidus necator N-1]|uniref:Flavin-dependent monooxygenase oxygenase subunit n=1 Tax=Cupriavidus necator (strain ATCC 43291 / DSM 13513 / CCUG 52238 / LMG 8453 / N-1) TaxID=1042878 RepID=F8GVR4_CUPNN|nr:acyl-CoA dehydrogenase family protein [Cupriavidus necator]AEI82684.1 flavin-dependent monooxygenase oxygenase subunit [Cupriavidus necator N-1]MDX6007678.1 acyl-CoA dehydrogenase family protein [Cupriavidus necator]